MDGFYTQMGLNKDADPKQVKRAYRKCSLRLHPDKGGDAAAFQCLNRAYVVLRDPKRRKRYDIMGFDIDFGGDNTSEAVGDEDESGLPSVFNKECDVCMRLVRDLGIGVFLLAALLQVVQYYWLVAILTVFISVVAAAMGYSSWKDDNIEKSNFAVCGGALAVVWLMWWSTQAGWLFWIFESAATFMIVLQLLTEFWTDVGVQLFKIKAVAAGIVLFCVAWAWWFNGRAFRYFVLLLLLALALVAVFFFFSLAGMLVEATVDAKLKQCSPKIRWEICRLQREREVLISRLQESNKKAAAMQSGRRFQGVD